MSNSYLGNGPGFIRVTGRQIRYRWEDIKDWLAETFSRWDQRAQPERAMATQRLSGLAPGDEREPQKAIPFADISTSSVIEFGRQARSHGGSAVSANSTFESDPSEAQQETTTTVEASTQLRQIMSRFARSTKGVIVLGLSALSVLAGIASGAIAAIEFFSKPERVDAGESPPGSITHIGIKGSYGVEVAGNAKQGVRSVVVVVGPRIDSQSQLWAGQTAVEKNGSWRLDVATPPRLPTPFNVEAYFAPRQSDSPDLAGIGETVRPTGPFAESSSLAKCVEKVGLSCLKSFGAPAVYRSEMTN